MRPTGAHRAGAVDLRVRIGAPVGAALLRALAATWRVRTQGADAWRESSTRGVPSLFALWHGHMLPLAWFMRGRGVYVLVSEHRDGEVIARILHALGLRTVRGSTTRGGARALVEMVRLLKAGESVAVTPDGPRGPARQVAPGTLMAAAKARVAVTPLFVTASRAWHLKTWDQFMIPKPLARVTVHFGDPVPVEADSPAAATALAESFAARIAPREDGTPVD